MGPVSREILEMKGLNCKQDAGASLQKNASGP